MQRCKGLLILFLGSGMLFSTEPARQPVLIELFTSEGCSSCPPADKLLAVLDREQPVAGAEAVVLSEHVDYWNHLGWADPYSSAAYTQRQGDYVRKMGLNSAYTPQIVVDGRLEVVGNDEAAVKAAIGKAAREQKVKITLTNVERAGSRLKLHVEVGRVMQASTLLIAIAEERAESHVTRGENAGRSLPHVAVVRELQPAGTVAASAEFAKDVSVPWKNVSGSVRVVAFVQEQATRHIVGAAQQHL